MTANILNMSVVIVVSEPWEFGTNSGTGPFKGTIVDLHADRLVIRLAAPIKYQQRLLRTVLARPRYEGHVPQRVASESLVANLMFIPAEIDVGVDVSPDKTHDGVAAIGTVERAG